jgi:hypothetical protein
VQQQIEARAADLLVEPLIVVQHLTIGEISPIVVEFKSFILSICGGATIAVLVRAEDRC